MNKLLLLPFIVLCSFAIDVQAQQAAYTYPIKTLRTKLTAENLYEPYFTAHVYPKKKFIRVDESDYSGNMYKDGLSKGLSYKYTKSSGYFLKQVYYDNGQLQSELYENPLDRNRPGYENTYYRNGQLESTVSRMNGIYVGLKVQFHENGNLEGRGMYLGELADGQQKGHWSYYYDSGQLKSSGSFENNFTADNPLEYSRRTGEWENYNEYGELTGTENY